MDTQELLDQLNFVEREFRSLALTLGSDQWHRRPSPESWSLAEIVTHLIEVTSSYRPFFEDLRKGSHRTPLLGYVPGYPAFMGKLLRESIHPKSRRQTKTFPIWEPQDAKYGPDQPVFDAFISSQNELKDWIQHTPVSQWKCILRSPASAIVVYLLSAAFEIMVLHQLRHLEQAKRIG